MVTCSHSQLDIGTLTKIYSGAESRGNRDWRLYIHCLAKDRAFEFRSDSRFVKDTVVQKCLPLLYEKCQPAKIRVMKFIRLTLTAAFSVAKRLDNVRIIHLVRDPRAMLDSNLRKKEMNVGRIQGFEDRAKMMCQKIRKDSELVDIIKTEYPGLLFSLRYEDFVDDPLGSAKELFDSIGENFLASDKEFVKSRSIEAARNSTIRAAVWRSHIPFKHLQIMDKHCKDVYEKFGYVQLTSVNVRNAEVISHVPRNSV